MAKNSYYLLDECFPEVLMEHHRHVKDSSLVNILVEFLFKCLNKLFSDFQTWQQLRLWLSDMHDMTTVTKGDSYHAEHLSCRFYQKSYAIVFQSFFIIMKPFWYLLCWNCCWLDSRVVVTVRSCIFSCKQCLLLFWCQGVP